jgi:hypothetical protein
MTDDIRELTHEEMLAALAEDPDGVAMLEAYKRSKPSIQAAWRRQDAQLCKMLVLGPEELRARFDQARVRPAQPGELRLSSDLFDRMSELMIEAAAQYKRGQH